jgi:hypothetical protein
MYRCETGPKIFYLVFIIFSSMTVPVTAPTTACTGKVFSVICLLLLSLRTVQHRSRYKRHYWFFFKHLVADATLFFILFIFGIIQVCSCEYIVSIYTVFLLGVCVVELSCCDCVQIKVIIMLFFIQHHGRAWLGGHLSRVH